MTSLLAFQLSYNILQWRATNAAWLQFTSHIHSQRTSTGQVQSVCWQTTESICVHAAIDQEPQSFSCFGETILWKNSFKTHSSTHSHHTFYNLRSSSRLTCHRPKSVSIWDFLIRTIAATPQTDKVSLLGFWEPVLSHILIKASPKLYKFTRGNSWACEALYISIKLCRKIVPWKYLMAYSIIWKCETPYRCKHTDPQSTGSYHSS